MKMKKTNQKIIQKDKMMIKVILKKMKMKKMIKKI